MRVERQHDIRGRSPDPEFPLRVAVEALVHPARTRSKVGRTASVEKSCWTCRYSVYVFWRMMLAQSRRGPDASGCFSPNSVSRVTQGGVGERCTITVPSSAACLGLRTSLREFPIWALLVKEYDADPRRRKGESGGLQPTSSLQPGSAEGAPRRSGSGLNFMYLTVLS